MASLLTLSRTTARAVHGRLLHSSPTLSSMWNVQDLEDFKKRVLDSKTPVLVDFYANWCGPCKMLGPRLETLVASEGEKVHLAKVDVDEHTDLAMEYNVTAVPAVVAIKDGQIIDRFVGLQDDDKIKSFIDRIVEP